MTRWLAIYRDRVDAKLCAAMLTPMDDQSFPFGADLAEWNLGGLAPYGSVVLVEMPVRDPLYDQDRPFLPTVVDVRTDTEAPVRIIDSI